MGLLSIGAKLAGQLPRLLPSGRTAAIAGGVAATGIAADVAFTGGEVLVAPVSENIGEAVGRASVATGTGLATGALDQALGATLPGVGVEDGGTSSRTAIAVGILIVGVLLFARK